MKYLLRISRGFAARDGSTVKSNLDYITTAPPPNLTRLLHNTASYAGYDGDWQRRLQKRHLNWVKTRCIVLFRASFISFNAPNVGNCCSILKHWIVVQEKKKSLVKLGIFTSCRGVKANKCTKRVMQVHHLNLFLFCCSRCSRRRRCLSSLISQTPPISFPGLFLPFSKGKFLGTSLNFHEWEMPLNGWNMKITARNTKERYE